MTNEPDHLMTGCVFSPPGAVALKFSAYADMAALPKVPPAFGHEMYDPPLAFQVWGNNQYGNCVVRGAASRHLLWQRMSGKIISFNTKDVLNDFQKITGLPLNPMTGADPQKAAAYEQHTGLLAADGNRYKIEGYLDLDPGNLHQLYLSTYLFGAAAICFRFSNTCYDQFRTRQSWHIVSGMRWEVMGHYVPCYAVRGGNIVCESWGRFQAMRPSFFTATCQQSLAYITSESLINRKSPEGFDWDSLVADFSAIKSSKR